MIIHIPQTPAGEVVGGYNDITHPHAINHLMIGELGNEEILLMACDDGDILAYNTRSIEGYIRAMDCSDGKPWRSEPRP